MKTKLLQASEIELLVQKIGLDRLMDTLISRLEETLDSYDASSSNIPIREGLHYTNPYLGLLEWMPVHLKDSDVLIKLVGYHPTNPTHRSLPSVLSTITLFDQKSGHLKGLIDGTFLTALRTGAMSAVASQILARPDCKAIGIIGAGAQSVTQIYALSRKFSIERVLCYDISPQAMQSLQSRIGFLNVPVETFERSDLNTLIAESDILCTCTSEEPGRDPVIDDLPMKDHLHINAVGSDFHDKVELPETLLKRAMVCPDFSAQAMHEGECQLLEPRNIGPDIAKLVKNRNQFKSLQDSLTVFDSTGWALADYVAGKLMIEEASRLGIGMDLEIECIPEDPKNPFSFMRQVILNHDDILTEAASPISESNH